MKSFLCISVIAVFLVVPSTAIDCTRNQYNCTCQPPSNPGMHIACKYPNSGPATACGKVIRVGLTQAEKDEIVNTHNRLRQFVAAGRETRGNPGPQPAATNMKFMRWDDEIAELAQRWANQCYYGHDDCRSVNRFYVGQNVAFGSSTSKPSDLINMWYNEVKYMDRNNVHKYKFSTTYGHYTQIVWANTKTIGCGKIIYPDRGSNRYYMVCNYGPGGNFPNLPIYKTN